MDDFQAADIFDPPDETRTPLTPDEMLGLIPSHIALRSELNSAEQANIARGQIWASGRRRDLLTENFVKALHKRMFEEVWRWAGKFRTSERNLGIAYWEIPVALRILLDDARAWIEFQTFAPDEIAVRFHHRLVQIHPFPNGNGRHARLLADLLAMQLGVDRFTWGSASVTSPGELRATYIQALRSADDRDLGPLLRFARS